jgi:hypothetical protein
MREWIDVGAEIIVVIFIAVDEFLVGESNGASVWCGVFPALFALLPVIPILPLSLTTSAIPLSALRPFALFVCPGKLCIVLTGGFVAAR